MASYPGQSILFNFHSHMVTRMSYQITLSPIVTRQQSCHLKSLSGAQSHHNQAVLLRQSDIKLSSPPRGCKLQWEQACTTHICDMHFKPTVQPEPGSAQWNSRSHPGKAAGGYLCLCVGGAPQICSSGVRPRRRGSYLSPDVCTLKGEPSQISDTQSLELSQSPVSNLMAWNK